MVQTKSPGSTALFPAFVAALACVFCIRSGFFVFFFLVPLGFIGYGWGPKTLWPGVIFAFLGNLLFTLGLGLFLEIPLGGLAWDTLFFAAITAVFAWILFPPGEFGSRIPGSLRLAAGSCVGALVFVGVFFRAAGSRSFIESLRSQLELITALYQSNGGQGTQSPFPESLDIEAVLAALKQIMLRGGALFSSVFVFFVNRQLSIFLVRLFGGPRRPDVFMSFYADRRLIWGLSFALLLLPVSIFFRWTIPEILLWNMVTLCGMMYLAQGLGIIRCFLARPGIPPFLRFLLPVALVFLLFSPGINAVLLGGIILLGIAENWVSFRALIAQKNP